MCVLGVEGSGKKMQATPPPPPEDNFWNSPKARPVPTVISDKLHNCFITGRTVLGKIANHLNQVVGISEGAQSFQVQCTTAIYHDIHLM